MGQPPLPTFEELAGSHYGRTCSTLETVGALPPLPLGEHLFLDQLQQAHEELLEASLAMPDGEARITYEIAAIGLGFEIGVHEDTAAATAEIYFDEGTERLRQIRQQTSLSFASRMDAGLLHSSVPLLKLRRQGLQSSNEAYDGIYDAYSKRLASHTHRALSHDSQALRPYRVLAGVPLLASIGDAAILDSLPFIATAREQCRLPGVTYSRQHLSHDFYFVNEDGKMPVRVEPIPEAVTDGSDRVLVIDLSKVVREEVQEHSPRLAETFSNEELTHRVLSWAIRIAECRGQLRSSREEIVHVVADKLLRLVVEKFPPSS